MTDERRPEDNLPTEVVEAYQSRRREVVMETAYILDALRDLGADQVAERFRVARLEWLADLEDKLRITDMAHTAREMFQRVDAQHQRLTEALESGDFTHQAIADFLEVYGPELQTEWETDDAERLAAQLGTTPTVIFTIMAAVRGDDHPIRGKHAHEAGAILGSIARALYERGKTSA